MSSIFQNTIKYVSKENRQCWDDLLEAATNANQQSSGQFNQFLNIIRNKLAFHYADLQRLRKGYKRKFFNTSSGEQLMPAFVSRGNNMQTTRFYFADAAMEGVLDNELEGKEEEFENKILEYARDINLSFFQIIDRFVQKTRKTPYSQYTK